MRPGSGACINVLPRLRTRVGMSASVDRLRTIDPQAAARIEQQRAEQGLRGQIGQTGGTFGG